MARKIISFLLVTIMICTLFCSCGNETTEARIFENYNLPDSISVCSTQTVSENENFSLAWNDESKIIILIDKRNNAVWSSTPMEFDINNPDNNSYIRNGLCSMLNLTYIDAKDNLEKEISAYEGAFQDGYIGSKQIEDGIRISYYFDNLQIMIPVDYTLDNNGLNARVRLNKVEENENLIYKISLLPFLSSAQNNTDSYLFVPSGNGALMYVDAGDREARKYSEPVYGEDAGMQSLTVNIKHETVRMPVFGVKNQEKGLIGIITEGAELATIDALAGDTQYGYSSVYPTFQCRGFYTEMVDSVGDTDAEVTKYSDVTSGVAGFTVHYSPLLNDVTYNGMASEYREYLENKYNYKNNKIQAVATLDFLGGQKIKEFLFGVPNTTLKVATTFDDVKNILEDMKDIDAPLAVRLTGFGDSGVNYGIVGSGLDLSSKFGGKKGYNTLSKWCDESDIPIFINTEMLYYNKTSKYFSTRKSAISVNDTRSKIFDYDMVTNNKDSGSEFAYLTSRKQLVHSLPFIREQLKTISAKGVCFSTLSNTAYSDYGQGVYFVKANMGIDVQYIYENIKKDGYLVMSESANEYAAVASDIVFDTPIYSSKLYVLDKDIPFYNMVFRGITTLSSQPINLSVNPEKAFLEALSLGNTLSFTLVEKFDNSFIMSDYEEFASAVYSDIKQSMFEYIEKAKPLIDKLGNARIISYEKFGDLSITIFDNSTELYVNFGEESLHTSVGEVAPKSYLMN